MRGFGIALLALAAAIWPFFAFAQDSESGEAAPVEAAAAQWRPVGPHAGEEIFARDSYALTPIVCPFKAEIKYKPGEISCGLLRAPENREKPDSRFIDLHYVKIAARKPKDWDAEANGAWTKRDDPIIYLTGGPGAQVAGYVRRFKDHGVRNFRDLFILEQRGIGYSQDFCPLYNLIDPAAPNNADYMAYQRARLKAMEDCFAAAAARGVDLSAYNTIENARDVKALRRALGFEQWNMWGISYGSILAQAYLKEDPEGIRAAVIDAIVPIAPGARFQKIGGNYQRDLDLLESACADNPVCAGAFPDFQDRLKAAIVKVRDSGPITIDAIDTELFPGGEAYFHHDLIGALPFIMLYEQDNYAGLPAFISAWARLVEEEDYQALRVITAGGAGGPGGFAVSQGMYNAIMCNDNWAGYLRKALEEDAREHPILASIQGDPALADEIVKICLRYGMKPRPAAHYAPVETDIRTLLVEGRMDPVTPPPFAKMIEPGFSNATYVEFPYAGHGPSRSVECAGDFLTKYFDEPDGELDLSCVEEMKAPDFIGRLYQTRALTQLAARVAEDQKNAALPALWLGSAVFILFIAAIIYTLAPAARLINGSRATPTGGARALAWLTATSGTAAIAGLAYAGYATYEANAFLFLVGLAPLARWFVLLGLAAGVLGAGLLALTARARRRQVLPIGVLAGLLLTGAAGLALASFLLYWGFAAG